MRASLGLKARRVSRVQLEQTGRRVLVRLARRVLVQLELPVQPEQGPRGPPVILVPPGRRVRLVRLV